MMRTRQNLLLFILLMAAGALPLLVHYDTSGPARIMENLSIMSSQETWLRMQQGEEQAWLVPTWNGRPRVNKPPMLVWLNLLIWRLAPADASVDLLIGWARLLAAGFALLALASTYLITARLANHRLARLAMLLVGSSFLFIRQGRFATYDTHLLGWSTLAVAMGCLALIGRRTKSSTWWFLPCGLALGGALLTKGPVALLFVLPPLVLFAAMWRPRRRTAPAGLVSAALLGLLLFGSWYVYIFLHHPDAWAWVIREYRFPARAEASPFWYYAGLVPLLFPWSVWFLVALFLPFRAKTFASRRIFFPPWLWLVSVLTLLSLSHAKNARYILPLVPAAGIMTALYFGVLEKRFAVLHRRGAIRMAAIIHWTALGTACLALPAAVLLQSRFAVDGSHPLKYFPHLPGVASWVAWLLGMLLPAGWVMSLRAFQRGAVIRSACITAFMLLAASSVGYYAYAVSEDNGSYPQRADAERLAAYCADQPLHYYSIIPDEKRIDPFCLPKPDRDPDKEFLIYYRGIISSRTPEAIRDGALRGIASRVCVRDMPQRTQLLESWGFQYVFTFEDGTAPAWKLYEFLP
ncbi:MAG: phospholipid carrier-dependent glycosyltransferase [Kiritimatiellae bacterium]|nr:phospholipid carrier-dependent glycosyltransferase [Kiritimatiellia bacterium]